MGSRSRGIGEGDGTAGGGSRGMGDDDGAMGAEITGVESGWCVLGDGTDAVGAGVVGGQIRSSFKEKIFLKNIFR